MALQDLEVLTHCPNCGGHWLGKKIPKSELFRYKPDQTHYSLLLVTAYPGEPNKFHYMCPHCKATWE